MTAYAIPTLADFENWLNAEQQRALEGMHATTGEDFSAHLDVFAKFTGAINAVMQFQNAMRKAQSTTGVEG